jgi:hypothetical protein
MTIVRVLQRINRIFWSLNATPCTRKVLLESNLDKRKVEVFSTNNSEALGFFFLKVTLLYYSIERYFFKK